MLDVSPQFSGFGWMMTENSTAHTNYFCSDKSDQNSVSVHLLHSPVKDPNDSAGFSNFQDEFHPSGDVNKMAKKLNHNASERDRRKKINTMYSTLRLLLPPEDQSRKLSIPATVSRVLKYIPELQKEVDRLQRKKETLLVSDKTSVFQEDATIDFRKQQSRKPLRSSSPAVSATRIAEQEIIFQISMSKSEQSSFSEALKCLEMDGSIVLSASCFQSSQGRVFYNVHLQGQGCQIMDVTRLEEKLEASMARGKEGGLK